MADFYCDQVLSGKLPVQVVYDTPEVLAFHHTQPYFEHHIVIIPKTHIASMSHEESTNARLAVAFMEAIQFVTRALEKEVGGCRVSSNVGSYQSTKHLHWYVHAGKRLRHEDGREIGQ